MMVLFRGWVYSNLFVAMVLASLAVSAYAVVPDLEFRWYVPLSVFLGSFVLYTFHRLYRIDTIPKEQLGERHRWVLKRADLMKVAMSVAVFLLMIILPNFQADTVVWLVPAGIVSVGYTIPILPTQHGWQRFRDIPLTKPLIISLVVTYLTLAYPLFEQFGIRAVADPIYFQLFVERFLFLMVVTIPFDMRDIVNDQDAGIQTLGTRFGFDRAKGIGVIVGVAWFASVAMQLLVLEWSLEKIISAAIILGFVALGYSTMKESWKDLQYIFVFEGLILVHSGVHTLASMIQTVP